MSTTPAILEVLCSMSDPVPTGLGFDGLMDWKLTYPEEIDEAVIIEAVAKNRKQSIDEVIDNILDGKHYTYVTPNSCTVIQADNVLPVPLFKARMKGER